MFQKLGQKWWTRYWTVRIKVMSAETRSTWSLFFWESGRKSDCSDKLQTCARTGVNISTTCFTSHVGAAYRRHRVYSVHVEVESQLHQLYKVDRAIEEGLRIIDGWTAACGNTNLVDLSNKVLPRSDLLHKKRRSVSSLVALLIRSRSWCTSPVQLLNVVYQ